MQTKPYLERTSWWIAAAACSPFIAAVLIALLPWFVVKVALSVPLLLLCIAEMLI